MIPRRTVLAMLGGGALAAAASCAASPNGDRPQAAAFAPDRRWLAKLTESIDELDEEPAVSGRLPPDLRGTLYRNGPGLFARNGFHKWTLLDGDGMIRAFTFADGRVRFRNRFVRTPKFQRETAAGAFLYPTWTTPAPDFFENIPEVPPLSQAGVTPVVKGGVLYAFDEVGKPYGLNPATLETVGEVDPHGADGAHGANDGAPTSYKAHTKTDGATGAWILAGTSGRAKPRLHAMVKDAGGRPVAHTSLANPRGDYYHDFFWTGRHVVFHLHPTPFSPLPMLLGFSTYVDALSWQPERGSLIVVVDPAGSRPPVTMTIPATWMWHSINAWEQGDSIVADFIGYDAPDHFFGRSAAMRAVMWGEDGVARAAGRIRRITIDPTRHSARLETVVDGHFEFPVIDPSRAGQPYRWAFAAVGDITNGWFHDGIARIDMQNGRRNEFRFGRTCYAGEPVFVPRDGGTEGEGWLLAEVLDGATGRSAIAIFDAAHVEDGPVAEVRLPHHLPFSFHGWWQVAA